MRTLFIKIFLWFWFAITLASIANFIMAITMPTGPAAGFRGHLAEDRRHMLGQMFALYGRMAPALFEQQGRVPLEQSGYGAAPFQDVRAFLFAEDGKTLLAGHEPPPLVRDAAAAAAGDVTQTTFNRNGFLAMAKTAAGPGGRHYVVAAGMPAMPSWAVRHWIPFSRLHGTRLAVSLFIGSIICYILAWRLTAPIRRLRAAAQRLASGDLTARVGIPPGKGGDEVADLGRDLDRMAERIEALVEAQKRLLRDISHELRSPLARLNVALGLVRQQRPPAVEGYLDRIEGEAERLNELIGQLLTLTVLESGNELEAMEDIDLAALVAEIADDAGFEANGCKREVLVTGNETLSIPGNLELLRRAIENVVRNAVRYTSEGTAVEISLRKERDDTFGHGHVVISVRDHGPGVPEAVLGNLFRPFYRVADARDRQSGGTGIGLAIAERALHLHGGTIAAQNAPDGGLLVRIRLPLKQ